MIERYLSHMMYGGVQIYRDNHLYRVPIENTEPLSQVKLFTNTDCEYYFGNPHLQCAVNPDGCNDCPHFAPKAQVGAIASGIEK